MTYTVFALHVHEVYITFTLYTHVLYMCTHTHTLSCRSESKKTFSMGICICTDACMQEVVRACMDLTGCMYVGSYVGICVGTSACMYVTVCA